MPRLRTSVRAWVLLPALILGAPVLGAPQIEFASVEAARAVLGARDEFVRRLSPFDRAARLRSADAVSEAEYLEFVRRAPREWTPAERARIAAALAAMEPALSALLPATEAPVLLVKTSGEEEGGAAGYTRANAIVLSALPRAERALRRILAHELFHVASRNQPSLRRELYEAIGFRYCGEVHLPPALAALEITNPDAPVNDHCIRVAVDGVEKWVVPVLLSSEPRYDPAAGRELFAYLTLSMLVVERSAEEGAARPVLEDGSPVLVPIERLAGFFEQIGRNTRYFIHPEEILASNFELLVLGEGAVPSPEVLERVRRVLLGAAERR